MTKFFLALFLSFLLAKAQALQYTLSSGTIDDNGLKHIILFFNNVLYMLHVSDILYFNFVTLYDKESTVIANTILTYTPIFYIALWIVAIPWAIFKFFMKRFI